MGASPILNNLLFIQNYTHTGDIKIHIKNTKYYKLYALGYCHDIFMFVCFITYAIIYVLIINIYTLLARVTCITCYLSSALQKKMYIVNLKNGNKCNTIHIRAITTHSTC